MYTTHNDLVVRAVDVNGEPIRGASVRLIDPSTSRCVGGLCRKKREDKPKLGNDEQAQHFAMESVKSSDADWKIDNVDDYVQYAVETKEDDTIDEKSTNELGEVTFHNLPVGKTFLVEIKTKAGYVSFKLWLS